MGFRITTNMMMNSYRYNLQGSTVKLSDARDKVLTQRNFNSYAEDPAAATQAFRLRRDWYQTDNQLNSNKNVYSKFNTAWQNLQGMLKDLINPMDKVSAIRGNSDTAGESRQALAQVLRESSESMIQGFNQKLGDHFIFAGNDALNVPFEWKGDELYYRGINVNSGGVCKPTAEEPAWLDDWSAALEGGLAAGTVTQEAYDQGMEWIKFYRHETDVAPEEGVDPETTLRNLAGANPTAKEEEWIQYYAHKLTAKPTADEPAWATSGNPQTDKYGVPTDMPAVGTNEIEQGWINYYQDQGNLAKLKEMSEEEMYIDLGMGAKENAPNDPIRGSYFNSALSGLNYTSFGVDEDGDSKNFAVMLKELADVFDTWGENGQKYLPEQYRDMESDELKALMESDPEAAAEIKAYDDEATAKAMRLMDKLKEAQEFLTAEHVELEAQSAYLQTNQLRLESQKTDLNYEILDVEQVDLAEAITDFSWEQYCYNAALKIGNQLLSQSLIDYMR